MIYQTNFKVYLNSSHSHKELIKRNSFLEIYLNSDFSQLLYSFLNIEKDL